MVLVSLSALAESVSDDQAVETRSHVAVQPNVRV